MEHTLALLLDLLWANAFGVSGWVIRIGALVVVPFRRSAAEARTWLLAFFIAPLPTLLIYLAIGRPQHSKQRQALFAKLPDMLQRAVDKSGIPLEEVGTQVAQGQQGISALVQSLASLPPLKGNAVEMLADYDGVIDRLVEDIDAASHHVHLEFYIFADDRTGQKVVDALDRARTRGIACRVLIDAMGSFGFGKKSERRLQRAGVEVYRILPLTRRWNASRIDLRNHRKIAIIDGRIGYTGSQNIVNPESSKGFCNQELMCRVRGPIVGALQLVFLGDWYLETETEPDGKHFFDIERDAGEIALQALPSGPDYNDGRVDMVFADLIYSAKSEVVIANPYFIPNEALLQALTTVAARGVKVTLILSRNLDSWLVAHAQRSYYAELLRAGVKIQLFQPNFLHAKHMRIDHSIALIGSSNMDMRSFELNAEISLLGYGDAIARQLQESEQAFLATSSPLKLADWQQRPLVSKVVENSMRLLSDLL